VGFFMFDLLIRSVRSNRRLSMLAWDLPACNKRCAAAAAALLLLPLRYELSSFRIGAEVLVPF
jgi:hypothetical protein